MRTTAAGQAAHQADEYWAFAQSLTNSVYLTLRQRWARGAVVHGVR